MIGLTSSGVVVMPTWVFAFFLIGGIAIISYLLWACDISQQDLRHERRRRVVHDHLHHDGPPPASVFLELDTRFLERLDRENGGR